MEMKKIAEPKVSFRRFSIKEEEMKGHANGIVSQEAEVEQDTSSSILKLFNSNNSHLQEL